MDNLENTSQHTFYLPVCGKKVQFFDIQRADGHMLMKARMLSTDGASVGMYVLAQICTFDGEKLTQADIMDMDFEDVMTLENEYYALKKKLLYHRKA